MLTCDACKKEGRSIEIRTIEVHFKYGDGEDWDTPYYEVDLCRECEQSLPAKVEELIKTLGGEKAG